MSALAYGTFVLYASTTASLLERLAVGQEATVLVSGVVHIYRYRIYREGGTRRNAQLLPRISLMN